MLAPKCSRNQDLNIFTWLIESNLLNIEMIACIIFVAIGIGTFVMQATNPFRASESFVGVFFLPTTIATGKFSEQLYYEPRFVPIAVRQDEKRRTAVPVLRKN